MTDFLLVNFGIILVSVVATALLIRGGAVRIAVAAAIAVSQCGAALATIYDRFEFLGVGTLMAALLCLAAITTRSRWICGIYALRLLVAIAVLSFAIAGPETIGRRIAWEINNTLAILQIILAIWLIHDAGTRIRIHPHGVRMPAGRDIVALLRRHT